MVNIDRQISFDPINKGLVFDAIKVRRLIVLHHIPRHRTVEVHKFHVYVENLDCGVVLVSRNGLCVKSSTQICPLCISQYKVASVLTVNFWLIWLVEHKHGNCVKTASLKLNFSFTLS